MVFLYTLAIVVEESPSIRHRLCYMYRIENRSGSAAVSGRFGPELPDRTGGKDLVLNGFFANRLGTQHEGHNVLRSKKVLETTISAKI